MKTLPHPMFAALVAVLCLAAPAAADEPPVVTGDQVTVTEVLLDVVVTDKRGNVVLGLGAEDFVVEENGEPVELNDVSFYSHSRFLEGSQRARELGIDAEATPGRNFILFFHDQRRLLPRLGARQLEAGRRARQWVMTELTPNDQVAVVSFDTSLRVYQDFTNDAASLEAAISLATQGRKPVAAAVTRQPEGAPSMVARLEGKPAIIYEALETVANATRPIRGRKNLALFSIGFGEVDIFGLYTPDRRYYPGMARALNDANVAVYPVDLIPNSPSIVRRNLENSLSRLASDTGGEYYFNFVNFITPLEQMTADTNGYYLLSYAAERDGDRRSGYQRVKVDTRNPEFKVRAREGYSFGEPNAGG